jgi:putative transcriptional regulator
MKRRTVSRKKTPRYMRDAAFAEFRESLNEALDHAQGERADLRVTRIPFPTATKPISASRVARIRRHLNFSQAMFARLLNVSPRTVQDWEQGRRVQSDAALKLLVVAEKHPDILLHT